MTNWDLLTFIRYICNKEQHGGSITEDQYNQIAPIAQLIFYDNDIAQYERTGISTNVIERMKVVLSPDLSINSNGTSNLPSDFYHWGSCYYTQTIGSSDYVRVVVPVTDQEYDEMIGSSIVVPTSQYPICKRYSSKIQFSPLKNTYVKFNYLRYPATPFIDFYQDDQYNIIYKEAKGVGGALIRGDSYSQISNLVLSGTTLENSDGGMLYWNLSYNHLNSLYELFLYKDIAKLNAVAYAQVSSTGSTNIIEANNSGITGTVDLTIEPYYTFIGNTLNKITSSSLYGVTEPLNLYWELKCIPNLVDGYTVETQFNTYLNSSKGTLFFSSSLGNAVSGTANIIGPHGEFGTVVISNAFTSDIVSDSEAKAILSYFRIVQNIFNDNTFYYDVYDDGSNVTVSVYSDVAMANKIMSGSTPRGGDVKLSLQQSNLSGLSGIIHVNSTVNGLVINGDTNNQLLNLTMVGLDNTTTDNGILYYNIYKTKGFYSTPPHGLFDQLLIFFYNNSLKRNSDIVASFTILLPDVGITPRFITYYDGYYLYGGTDRLYYQEGDTYEQMVYHEYTNIYEQLRLSKFYYNTSSTPINDTDSGNTIQILSLNYSHSGHIDYSSGDWDLNNVIQIKVDMDDSNKVISYPDSQTVEMEWRDEDKIRIAGRMLEMIGLNLKDQSIIQYAQEFKAIKR